MAGYRVLCAVLSAILFVVAVNYVDANCENATQFATAADCWGPLLTVGHISLCNASASQCRMLLDEVLANCTSTDVRYVQVQQGIDTICNAPAGCFNASRDIQRDTSCDNSRVNLTTGEPIQPSDVCYGNCRTMLDSVVAECGNAGVGVGLQAAINTACPNVDPAACVTALGAFGNNNNCVSAFMSNATDSSTLCQGTCRTLINAIVSSCGDARVIMAGNTPKRINLMGKETRERLERCWKEDIDWDLYPEPLKQGLIQVGTALNVPPTALLSSLVSLCGFMISPSVVQIDGTGWKEPVLIWECICMPTGAGTSPLCSYIYDVLCKVKHTVASSVCWEVGDSTFEIMGQLMHRNSCRIIGIYDELTTFLTELNVYQGKGLSSSHELSLFLQLYNGHGWHRSTANVLPPPCDDANLEGYTLLQLGEKLDISALVKAKRYKGRGNKVAAVEACKKLQEKGFGTLLELGSSRGTPMKYVFEKLAIPTEIEERTKFAENLATIGVSLSSYSSAYESNSEPPAKKARAS